MVMRAALQAALALLCRQPLAASAARAHSVHEHVTRSIVHDGASASAIAAWDSEARNISQPLDHFDPLSTRSWEMRYWVEAKHWSGSGDAPVFLSMSAPPPLHLPDPQPTHAWMAQGWGGRRRPARRPDRGAGAAVPWPGLLPRAPLLRQEHPHPRLQHPEPPLARTPPPLPRSSGTTPPCCARRGRSRRSRTLRSSSAR